MKKQLSFTFRPPADIDEALTERANLDGAARSVVVIAALRQFLDRPEPTAAARSLEFERLTARVEALEEYCRDLRATVDRRSLELGTPALLETPVTTDKGAHSSQEAPRLVQTASAPPHDGRDELQDAIALLDANRDFDPKNATTALKAVKEALRFIKESRALSPSTREAIIKVLAPDVPFKRNAGGRVKTAIREVLELLAPYGGARQA